MPAINEEQVIRIFRDSLFKDDEDTANHVVAPGMIHPVGFHPQRIASHKDEIRAILLNLPIEFMKSGGGGWSFLNMCLDKDGEQWTAFHLSMEKLVQLGEATGLVTCQVPREVWSALPGGVPYYVVNDDC